MLWKVVSAAFIAAAIAILGGAGASAIIGLWGDRGVASQELVQTIAPLVLGLVIMAGGLIVAILGESPKKKQRKSHVHLSSQKGRRS
jgi:hypothetical protein